MQVTMEEFEVFERGNPAPFRVVCGLDETEAQKTVCDEEHLEPWDFVLTFKKAIRKTIRFNRRQTR